MLQVRRTVLLAGRRDDDADHLPAVLRREGFDVLLAADVATLEYLLDTRGADAVIIHHDIDGAGCGFVMSRKLRRDTDLVIVMIDVPTTEDRVAAFDIGLDDCLPPGTKSIEIVARLRTIFDRRRAAPDVADIADLHIDERSRCVVRDGDVIDLTRIEFDVLHTLARHSGHVISKNTLLDTVWNGEAFDPNLVEVHVSSLRRKLGPNRPKLIYTVRGVGYVLRPTAAAGRTTRVKSAYA
jgi:two-component system, OmpR family, response regulator